MLWLDLGCVGGEIGLLVIFLTFFCDVVEELFGFFPA